MSKPELLTISVRNDVYAKVLTAGEGKPVIFLHGAGGLKWDRYLDELSKEYKVFAPYFPGTGGTTGSAEMGIRNLWDIVLYYADLFDVLNLDTFDLIGHSFGGMLAAEIAATDPRRISNLLLLCPTGLWDETIEKNFIRVKGDTLSKLFYDPESKAAKEHTALPEHSDDQLKALTEQQLSMAEANRFLWPIPDKGLKHRIHRIKAKTTIVWGKEDRVLPVGYASMFQQSISGSRLELYSETSHFPQLEQLQQTLNVTFETFAHGHTIEPISK